MYFSFVLKLIVVMFHHYKINVLSKCAIYALVWNVNEKYYKVTVQNIKSVTLTNSILMCRT